MVDGESIGRRGELCKLVLSSSSQACAVSLNRINSRLAELSTTIASCTDCFTLPLSLGAADCDSEGLVSLASAAEEATAICSRLGFIVQGFKPALEVVEQASATKLEAWSQKLKVDGVSTMIPRVAIFIVFLLASYAALN